MELQQQKNKSSSKIVIVIVSIIMIALAGTVGRKVASNLFSPSEESIETELLNLANELNKNCPFMVDAETRLDNTTAIKKNLHYNYTFINYSVDEIDIDYLETHLRPTVLNGIKTHPDMKYLRDRRVIFIYNYRDKVGKHLISFKFTPQEYL